MQPQQARHQVGQCLRCRLFSTRLTTWSGESQNHGHFFQADAWFTIPLDLDNVASELHWISIRHGEPPSSRPFGLATSGVTETCIRPLRSNQPRASDRYTRKTLGTKPRAIQTGGKKIGRWPGQTDLNEGDRIFATGDADGLIFEFRRVERHGDWAGPTVELQKSRYPSPEVARKT